MKTFTVEITEETAKQILPMLERQHRDITETAKGIECDISQIKEALKKSAVADSPDQGTFQILPHTNKKRKWGETEALVVSALQSANGTGLAASEIVKRTGGKIGNVYRILKKLSEKERVKQDDALWVWVA